MTTLYHGTRRGFRPGGYLTPPDFHGVGANWELDPEVLAAEPDRGEWVYVTPSIDVARFFATAAKGRGRPKILEVEPMAEVEPDPATLLGDPADLYRIRGWARVLRVLPNTVFTHPEVLA